MRHVVGLLDYLICRSCPCSLRLMLQDFCQSVWVGRSSRLSALETCFQPLLQPSWPSHSHTFPVSPPIVPLSSRLLRLWLWPRWDPAQEHFAQRPHPISEPRGHGGRTGPPLLSRARAVGRHRLRQRLAQGGMRQAEIIVHVIQGQLLVYAGLALTQAAPGKFEAERFVAKAQK